jgi:hypothetical protein
MAVAGSGIARSEPAMDRVFDRIHPVRPDKTPAVSPALAGAARLDRT